MTIKIDREPNPSRKRQRPSLAFLLLRSLGRVFNRAAPNADIAATFKGAVYANFCKFVLNKS